MAMIVEYSRKKVVRGFLGGMASRKNPKKWHIPSLLVVTPCALHNGLDIAVCSPHRVSSTDET
jgi:hypothetical protein